MAEVLVTGAISPTPKVAQLEKGASPLSVLALIIAALVLVQPLWGVLVWSCSWAAWLCCSLVLWDGAKTAVLPRVPPAYSNAAQTILLLATFVVLRLVFGWSTPIDQLSRWYFSAILLPALDTFVGLETVGGLLRFASAPSKRRLFPAPLG
jgi:hypothetical protein